MRIRRLIAWHVERSVDRGSDHTRRRVGPAVEYFRSWHLAVVKEAPEKIVVAALAFPVKSDAEAVVGPGRRLLLGDGDHENRQHPGYENLLHGKPLLVERVDRVW